MRNKKIAILLTCYNRKNKTIACLTSFFEANIPMHYIFDIFLTDDGSTDGTKEEISKLYPSVNIIIGNGNLFWAGGMRLAWEEAMKHGHYDAFLLLNDDVILDINFLYNLIQAEELSINKYNKKGIYSGATIDSETKKATYGCSKIRTNHFIVRHDLLTPKEYAQECEITNANILWIDKSVIDKIGFFDEKFTHGIADYDYSLRAVKNKIPVYLAPNICGICEDDHGNNWVSATSSLKSRISYLKSPKGLAYKEYLYYIKTHFPMFLPYTFIMLWMKTLFPQIWDKHKQKK